MIHPTLICLWECLERFFSLFSTKLFSFALTIQIPKSASLLVDLLPLFSTPLFPDHHNTFLVFFVISFLGGVTLCDVFLSIQKAHSMRTSVVLNRLHLLCLFSLWATFIAHSVTFQLSLLSCSNRTLKYLRKIILLLFVCVDKKQNQSDFILFHSLDCSVSWLFFFT